MESIGTYLRRERELRGLSLDEIADTTRIPVQSLSSLEDGRFTELPGDTFIRGFLKAYARALGVSHEDVLARYGTELRLNDIRPLTFNPDAPTVDRGRRFGLAIALVVFAILATLAMSFLLRPRAQDRPDQLSQHTPKALTLRA